MIRTIRAIVRKELIQLFRDKRMYLPLFVAPVIQLILFGYAASVDVRNVPFVLVDRARTEDSRALAAMFTQSGYFSLRAELGSEAEIDPWLQKGDAWAAIVVREDFSRRLGYASPMDDTRTMERRHLERVGIVAVLGLGLALLSVVLRFERLAFEVAVGLLVLAVLGLTRLVIGLRK